MYILPTENGCDSPQNCLYRRELGSYLLGSSCFIYFILWFSANCCLVIVCCVCLHICVCADNLGTAGDNTGQMAPVTRLSSVEYNQLTSQVSYLAQLLVLCLHMSQYFDSVGLVHKCFPSMIFDCIPI